MTERHCRCLVTSIHLGLQGLVLAVVNITGGQVKRVHVGLPVLKVYCGIEFWELIGLISRTEVGSIPAPATILHTLQAV